MIIYESQPRNLTNKKERAPECVLCNEQLHIHICFLVKILYLTYDLQKKSTSAKEVV